MFGRGTGRFRTQGREENCAITPENPTSQLIGCKVKIRTSDGDYQGVVKHVWGDLDKLSLAKVVAVPSEKKIVGVQHFFKQEISDIQVIEAIKKVTKNAEDDRKNQVRLQPLPVWDMNNEINPHYVGNEDSDDEDDGEPDTQRLTAQDASSYAKTGEITWKEDVDLIEGDPGPRIFQTSVPKKFFFLDEINQSFQDAIADMKSCKFIGLATECSKGRFGEINVLCVATNDAVYLFDIMVLGKSAFDRGLGSILESKETTKIVHDCRLLSDALFHLHRVELANVFDTQVGDVVLHLKNHNNRLPQYVLSLSHCMKKYLSLDSKFLPKGHQSYEELKKTNALWRIRPFPPMCREVAVHSVIFLQELRAVIMEKLLVDLMLGTSIYINAVRQASKEELALNLGSPHVLPPAMSRLTSQEMKLLHHYEIENSKTSPENIWSSNNQPTLNCRILESNLPALLKSFQPTTASVPRTTNQDDSHSRASMHNRSEERAPTVNGQCEISPRSNHNVLREEIKMGISKFLSDRNSDSSGNGTQDHRNARLGYSYSSLPKDKLIPAGQMQFSKRSPSKWNQRKDN